MPEPTFHPGARLLGDKLQQQFLALNAEHGGKLVFAFCVFDANEEAPCSLSTNIAISSDAHSRRWLAHHLRQAAEVLESK